MEFHRIKIIDQNQDNRHPSLPEIGYMAIQKRREKERE